MQDQGSSPADSGCPVISGAALWTSQVVGQASFTAVDSPHLFFPRGIYLHSESPPQTQYQLRV